MSDEENIHMTVEVYTKERGIGKTRLHGLVPVGTARRILLEAAEAMHSTVDIDQVIPEHWEEEQG